MQVRDVRAAFAGVPKIRPQWVDRYMKVLVVGESGALLGHEPDHDSRFVGPAASLTTDMFKDSSVVRPPNVAHKRPQIRRHGQDDVHQEPVRQLCPGSGLQSRLGVDADQP